MARLHYVVRFHEVHSEYVSQDELEDVEEYHELECDYFTLTLEPCSEVFRLNAWVYDVNGPVNVTSSFRNLIDFEYTDNILGDTFGLNAFNDLFWKHYT